MFNITAAVGLFFGGFSPGRTDCEFVPIDSDYTLEFINQRLSNESSSAICVDQQVLIRRNQIVNQITQCLCDIVVYLRKHAWLGCSPQRVVPVAHMFLLTQ